MQRRQFNICHHPRQVTNVCTSATLAPVAATTVTSPNSAFVANLAADEMIACASSLTDNDEGVGPFEMRVSRSPSAVSMVTGSVIVPEPANSIELTDYPRHLSINQAVDIF